MRHATMLDVAGLGVTPRACWLDGIDFSRKRARETISSCFSTCRLSGIFVAPCHGATLRRASDQVSRERATTRERKEFFIIEPFCRRQRSQPNRSEGLSSAIEWPLTGWGGRSAVLFERSSALKNRVRQAYMYRFGAHVDPQRLKLVT